MKIYSILEDRPELWQGEDMDRNAVASIAHAYVWELFKMHEKMQHRIFWHDLYRLIDIAVFMRDVQRVRSTHSDAESVKTAKEAGRKAKTVETLARDIVRYLKEYGGFSVDSVSVEQLYADYENHMHFLLLSDWPDIIKDSAQEDFKNLGNNRQTPFPKGFEDETAKGIYSRLEENGFIECEEKTFLWYFGDATDRAKETQPEKIKWKGQQNEFAYLCVLLNGNNENVKWQSYLKCFDASFTAKQLREAKRGIYKEKDAPRYPAKVKILEYCVKGEE